MHLAASGHPLHTRAFAIILSCRSATELDLESYVLDVRKRGFVPVGGDLQGPGIIHHMRLRGVVDVAERTLHSLAAAQPSVAFEPSALTAGESCRDPVGRIASLNGTRLDDGYGRALSAAFGGPRGCSHLLTLAHLVGPTVSWALAQTGESTAAWSAGERVFRRDLILDGQEGSDGTLNLAIQLTDLHLAPSAAVSSPMRRFAGELELRALLTADLATYTLRDVQAAVRQRDLATLHDAPWLDRSAVVAALVGLPLLQGFTAEIMRRFPDPGAQRPLVDALLMVGPMLIQCTAARSELWALQAKESASLVGMTGIADSCYMWRRGGALDQARSPDDPLQGTSLKAARQVGRR